MGDDVGHSGGWGYCGCLGLPVSGAVPCQNAQMRYWLLLALMLTLTPLPVWAAGKRSQSAIVDFKKQHPCPSYWFT